MSHLLETKLSLEPGNLAEARCPYCEGISKGRPRPRLTFWVAGYRLMHTCNKHGANARADYEGALDPVEESVAA